MLRLVALATLATAATNPCGRDVAWTATNATASLNATLFAPSARGDAPSAAALRLGVWRETSNATACWAARCGWHASGHGQTNPESSTPCCPRGPESKAYDFSIG